MTDFYTISGGSVALRLGLSFVTGAVVGLERENHGRAAGLRTTVLVSVAAAIAMILSSHLFAESAGSSATWRPDPARLAAGILTGIGFLGAGAILREGRVVRGVTTAAVLWFTTVLGLTFGAGQFALGLSGFALALVTLFVLPRIESCIHNDWYGSIIISLGMDGISDRELRTRIEQMGVIIKSVELDYDRSLRCRTLCCRIKYKKGDVFDLSERVVQNLMTCDGVAQVKWA